MSTLKSFPAVLLFVAGMGLSAQQLETKPADPAAGFRDEALVVEQLRTVVRFENDGSERREQSARVRVQSDAGVQRLSQLVFGYSSANEQLEMNYVRVRRADGSVVEATKADMQDLPSPVAREAPVYSDFREKHITVPGLQPGQVLEYSIVIRTEKPLFPNQFWTEYSFEKQTIVLDEQLEVNVPRGREIKLKTLPGSDPVVSDEGDRRVYRWKTANLVRESDADKKKKLKSPKPEMPDLELSTLRDWDEVGRWYWELQKDRMAPTPAIRAKAAELVKDKKTDLEKIAALYDFVATNFHYVSLSFGLGRYQPHAAGEILENRYGDCKDKHTLLAAMLESEGFVAYPALMNSSRPVDPDVPAPSQFDHVITVVPLKGEYLWMDTTTEVAPFRLLAGVLRNKKALVIPADRPASLVETPANPPFPNHQVMELEGKISELGKLEATVKQTSRGDNELALRAAFRRTSSSQWKDLVQSLDLFYGLPGEVSEVKADDPADTSKPFHFEYKVSQPNYLDWSARKTQPALFVPVLGLPDVDAEATDKDAEPLRVGAPGETDVRLKLELPQRYLARAPVPMTVKRDYGEYHSTYSVEGSRVSVERVLVMNVSELPATRARDYLAFRRALHSDEEQKLQLETTLAGTPTIPESAKADDLHESALAALRNRNYELAVQLLQRVVELDPRHKYAWNNLGRAYLGLQKTDDAIRAFQKAAEIDPYDEWAYNNLGLAYWRQQKYEDAVSAFRKQLEINPLDEFAHGNLGAMYVEWHKYEDAVPELEKAASLKPENAIYQVGLGQSYLNLGQPDKALAAFDKAVELQPAPEVWNDVAYELSLRKVHLDRAQQYAESAIAATAAALRNVSLDHLRIEDLGLVGALAAYWDTLGWIYFQKGDLKQAEEFINAAWTLDQHSEIGDHLAQIYERRGEKAKAERLYAMALAAARPSAETRPHLAALVGEQNVGPAVDKYRGELARERTLKLGPLVKENAEAEFWVALAAGPKVESVKFIRGNEKLKPFSAALLTARFPEPFPDSTPTHVIRRGVLSCSQAVSDCTFVLVVPEDVTSVD
jgi:Flp pilus assembly protein TadD/transglutaminase-like putative cysteine protease